MYNFKEAIEVIETKLGEHSSLISGELKSLLSESNSVVRSLSDVNSESANRRVELKDIKVLHAKEIESFGDHEALKTKLTEKESQITIFEGQLKGFYDSNKSKLKTISESINFEDEKYAPVKHRFSDLEKIEDLSNDRVEQLIGDFELLGVSGLSKKSMTNQQPTNKKQEKQESVFKDFLQ